MSAVKNWIEERDRILQNLRDLLARLSDETDEDTRTRIEAECHMQLDRLELLDGKDTR